MTPEEIKALVKEEIKTKLKIHQASVWSPDSDDSWVAIKLMYDGEVIDEVEICTGK